MNEVQVFYSIGAGVEHTLHIHVIAPHVFPHKELHVCGACVHIFYSL